MFARAVRSTSEGIAKDLEQHISRWAICSGWHDEVVAEGKPGENSPFATREVLMQKRNSPEIGGFLLGQAHKRADKTYRLQIEKFVSVITKINGEYEVTFGRKAFMELDDAFGENPELRLMGWMHTHHGHSLFLSSKDVDIIDANFEIFYPKENHIESLPQP